MKISSLAHLSFALLVTLFSTPLQAQDLDPITPDDYGQWESLGAGVLSQNGEWLAVPITRVNEENELRLFNIASGALTVIDNGEDPAFSEDGGWLAYTLTAEEEEEEEESANSGDEEAEQADEDEEEERNNLGISNLLTDEKQEFLNVESFEFSAEGAHLLMARYSDDDTRSIVVKDLAGNSQMVFGNVSAWSWQDIGSKLAFTVHGEDDVGNGVQLFEAASGQLRSLDSGDAKYAELSWRDDSSDLAVLRAIEDDDFEDESHHILAWLSLDDPSNTSRESFELDPRADNVIAADERIVAYRALSWADDSNSIFFGAKDWDLAEVADDEESDDAEQAEASDGDVENNIDDLESAGMEIWKSTDIRTIVTQKYNEDEDEEKNDLLVWHLDSDRIVRLVDDTLDDPRIVVGGRLVLASDDKPYEFDGMFGRGTVDIHAIDVDSGEHKIVAENVRPRFSASTSGRYVQYFRDGGYYAYDLDEDLLITLSDQVDSALDRQEYDHPVGELPPWGTAGWTAQDSLLVYDEFDVWELSIEGLSRRVTDGRASEDTFRIVDLDEEQEYIDLAEDVYLSIRGKWTKRSGVAKLVDNRLTRLVDLDATIRRIAKAENADVYAYTAENFDDSPDYFVGDDFDSTEQLTASNPFQKDYAWGHTEFVEYKNHNGVPLHGALFYPANYDPQQQYPMIVYVYEIVSGSAKTYVVPSPTNYYNPSIWTAEGYFVFLPDIVFDPKDPGVSSAKTLELAVNAVLQSNSVDPDKVGLVGHSWGGYQAQFVPTYTDIFAASVAGAGISNLITMYGSMFWSAGAPETGHFEVGQERMDVPYYVDPESFMRNSAVFNIQSLNTPLLLEVGDADQNVDWRQSIELYNVARRANKELTMLVYYDEGHGLRQEENQADYQRRILEWFDHYLKGEARVDWIEESSSWLEQRDK